MESSASPAQDASTAAAQFTWALRSADPIQKTQRLLAVLELMTKENASLYQDGWREFLRDNLGQDAPAVLLNRRFGQLIGAEVVGNRKGSDFDMSGARSWVRDQLLGWMDTDPGAARKWLDGLENEKFREVMIGSYLESGVAKNPAGAISILDQLPADLQKTYAGQMIYALRLTAGAAEVSNVLQTMAIGKGSPSPPWLKVSYETLMSSIIDNRTVGEMAGDVYAQHLGQPYANSSWGYRLAERYANTNPAQAINWAKDIAQRDPTAASDGKLPAAAIKGIPDSKLAEAVPACLGQPRGFFRDTLLASLANRLHASQPAEAASLAQQIDSPGAKPAWAKP